MGTSKDVAKEITLSHPGRKGLVDTMAFWNKKREPAATAAPPKKPTPTPGIEPATEWLDPPSGATEEELLDGRDGPAYGPNPAHKCGGFMRNSGGKVVYCFCRLMKMSNGR